MCYVDAPLIFKIIKKIDARRSSLRFRIVCTCLGMFLCASCTFEVLTKSRFLDFDFNGPSVGMSSAGIHHLLDITPYAAARGDFGYQVLLVNRRDGFIYAVLEVSGRSPGDTGVCAKGVEKNVVWIKLDRKLELQDVKTVLVESCPQNIHTANGCVVTDNRLVVNFVRDSMSAKGSALGTQKRESILRYDNDHPESGLMAEDRAAENR